MSNKKVLVCLVSNGVSDHLQASRQRKATTILKARKLPYVEVDGMNPDHKESREELFAISGIRGNYPQFFFVHANGATSYLGNFEKLEELNETVDIPDDVLNANPDLETWPRVFKDVVESFQ
ncbi:hypothetical protein CTEN210_15048 [Chaetoceros tenuissimus]|uniref:Glutaredoxin domain-containing protein n=1 Tax=Chaetoceros tenuissimus TaxID=426638 RepID=A0AAD3D615_9STRA|nr:hypothetical protein CTEN210_15048 [Chaetoceros tenuissimus]